MTGKDELAQLEAERDRLLSMIAYHNGPYYRESPESELAPAWFGGMIAAVICGIVIAIMLGLSDDQIDFSYLIFWAVLPVLLISAAYFLARGITVFGITIRLEDVIAALFLSPRGGPPVGETEALQRLADCEARIMKLKAGRS
jgi:hypothetical protein